ncbi:MAG: glycosyltransferase [Cyclobacteriaceae bacterium]
MGLLGNISKYIYGVNMNYFIKNPLVSVRIITYQHICYIKKCIESAIKQSTNFSYEICIGDDGSTDGTYEICYEYSIKYPELITLYRWGRDCKERENLPVSRYNFLNSISKCRGKYIAFLDGDDYWTNPHKLQTQVDILEKNNNISLVTHNAVLLSDDKKNGKVLGCKAESGIIPANSVIRRENGVIQTSTMVVRRDVLEDVSGLLRIAPAVDYCLNLLSLMSGKIYHIDQEMSIKRKHAGSLSGQDKDMQWYIDYHQAFMSSLNIFNEQTNNKYIEDLKVFRQKTDVQFLKRLIRSGFSKNLLNNRKYIFKILLRINIITYIKLLIMYIKLKYFPESVTI